MTKYYFAAFMPDEGQYSIVFPGLEGCFTCGESLEHGMIMAADVLSLVLRDMAEANQPIPEPCMDIAEIRRLTELHIKDTGWQPDGEILYMLVPAPSLDLVPVKLSISMPRAVLEEIDAKAKSMGFTRSGFLAHAAQVYTPERVREDMEYSFEYMLDEMKKVLEQAKEGAFVPPASASHAEARPNR